MTQEDKQLLIKDLCARTPYGVHCAVYKMNREIRIEDDIVYYVAGPNIVTLSLIDSDECLMFYQVKPYLRPMSNMTEEERADYHFYCETVWDSAEESYYHYDTFKSIDWLNEHHFDYRGLIPMGLALEAPKDMYKTE